MLNTPHLPTESSLFLFYTGIGLSKMQEILKLAESSLHRTMFLKNGCKICMQALISLCRSKFLSGVGLLQSLIKNHVDKKFIFE